MAQALANTPLPGEAAAPAAKPSVSVGTPALVRHGGTPRRAAPDRGNWIVQYVFQDDRGKTKLTIITVTAPSYEAAKAYAVEHVPGRLARRNRGSARPCAMA